MSNQVKTVGEAREVWKRNGLACPMGAPDYLFENAEALLKLEEKHARELSDARAAVFADATMIARNMKWNDKNGILKDHHAVADMMAEQIAKHIDAMASKGYTCPVCGFPYLANSLENHRICPSCGTQFDYDDYNTSHEELRQQWVEKGAQWWSSVQWMKPANWNAVAQLKKAGFWTEEFTTALASQAEKKE